MEYFTAAWLYDATTTAYVNNTVEAEIADGTAFEMMDETGDYFYFGFSRRFEMLVFDLETAGSYGALTWEYSDDSSDADSWSRIVPTTDSSLNTTTRDNYVSIKPPDDWASVAFSTSKPHAVASVPSTTARYWLRVSAASVTTTAEVNQIECVPYARYTSPDIVSAMLQIPDFSTSTQPTFKEVEDVIHRKESEIDYKAKKSWKYRVKLLEHHEFNLNGVRLMRNNIRDVISLEIWDGESWDTKSGAQSDRSGDYYWIPELGMIKFSRYFLLPARIAYTGPHWWGWGVGEFSYAIRVSYIWGLDLDTDEAGGFVEDLASMMAATELYRSHDYSILAISGSDKISLDRKVEQWELKIEDALESLRGWEVL